MKRAWQISIGTLCLFLGLQAGSVQAREIRDLGLGSAPDIAADSKGNLNIVFEGYEKDSKIPDIFFTQSNDGGDKWSAAKNISHAPGISSHPAIAVERDGAIDVVWSDTTSGAAQPDIYFARTTDGGKSWTEPKNISRTPGESTEPAIAAGPDNSIHVVWCDTSKGETNKDIYYCSTTDAGKTWSNDAPAMLFDVSNTAGASSIPAIAVADDGSVHAAWVDNSTGEIRPDIYYARKENAAWSKPIDVCSTARHSAHPSIASVKNNVYICWSDNSEQEKAADIWLAISDKSLVFRKPLNISSTIGASSEPDMASDQSGRVGIVWQDSSHGVEKPDIYARFSLDQCANFSNVFDLSNTATISMHADATISGHKMFVVWEELEATEMRLKVTSMELKKAPAAPADEVDTPTHIAPRP
jgi:BNR repeat-containing family member